MQRSELDTKLEMLREEHASVKAELERMHALHGETSQRVKVSEEELKKARADREAAEAAAKQLAEDQAEQAAALGMTLEQYKEQLAAKEAEAEAQRVKREEAEAKFLETAEMASKELAKANEEKENMKKDLVGKRKVHKEKGKEASLGFTYKKLSSGLFQVSKIKPGGFAEKSGLIQPNDVLHYVDGVACNEIKGPMALAELLQGPVGSECDLSLQRGQSPDVFIVKCTRILAADAGSGASPASLGSAVAGAAADRVVAPKDEDLQSIKSEASQSKAKAVSLGFTYKQNKDGSWKVSTIKAGGWADTSGEVKSGDLIIAVGDADCQGLDLKVIPRSRDCALPSRVASPRAPRASCFAAAGVGDLVQELTHEKNRASPGCCRAPRAPRWACGYSAMARSSGSKASALLCPSD